MATERHELQRRIQRQAVEEIPVLASVSPAGVLPAKLGSVPGRAWWPQRHNDQDRLTNKTLGELPAETKLTLRPHNAGRIETTPGQLMAEGRFKPFMTVGQVEFAFSRD